MSPLNKNIEITRKATQEIEKQLAESELPAKQIIVLAKQFTEHFNALSLLMQMKTARDAKSQILTPKPSLLSV